MQLHERTAWKRGQGLPAFILAALLVPQTVFAGGARQDSDPGGVVKFKYPEWVYCDLIYLVDDPGCFDDAKVRPKYVGQIAAGQMISAFTTGDLDAANRNAPLVAAAVASGADVKIFAAGSTSTQADPT